MFDDLRFLRLRLLFWPFLGSPLPAACSFVVLAGLPRWCHRCRVAVLSCQLRAVYSLSARILWVAVFLLPSWSLPSCLPFWSSQTGRHLARWHSFLLGLAPFTDAPGSSASPYNSSKGSPKSAKQIISIKFSTTCGRYDTGVVQDENDHVHLPHTDIDSRF